MKKQGWKRARRSARIIGDLPPEEEGGWFWKVREGERRTAAIESERVGFNR